MSEAQVLVVAVLTVGVLALGSTVLAAAVAVVLLRRLAHRVSDQLILPARAAISADPDVRRIAAVRRQIRRSVAATEQVTAYARAAHASGETVRLAARISTALHATDHDLAVAQRDPDPAVRREFAAAGVASAERLLAAAARLRTVLAGTARAAVVAETADLERDVRVEEGLAGEWAAVHRKLSAGPAAL